MSNENDLDQLYKDAYFSALIRKGLTDFQAEYEANRYLFMKKKL